MTSADLDRIEAALRIKLPPDYRRIMEEYPFPPESIGANMLMDDLDVLLRWNAREKETATPDSKDPSVRTGLFQIGSDGSELRFCIQLTDPANAIFCYDLESGKLYEYSKNIATYIELCARVDAGAENLPNEHDEIPEWVKWVVSLCLLALLILFGYGIFKFIVFLLH